MTNDDVARENAAIERENVQRAREGRGLLGMRAPVGKTRGELIVENAKPTRAVAVIVGEWIELCTLDASGTFVAVPGTSPIPLPSDWQKRINTARIK